MIALALLASGGCDIPESPLEPGQLQYVVHAVLDAGSTKQRIALEYSDGFYRPVEWLAEVTLVLPDGRELRGQGTGRPSPETYGVDLPSGERLQPGAEYLLRVQDGSKVITGVTTLPLAQAITDSGAVEAFSRQSDTLRLSWPRVAGVRAYHVAVQTHPTECCFGDFDYYYSTFADTSIVLPGLLHTIENERVFHPSSRATVVVNAVDDNFYSYYHPQVDPFAGAPPSRLNGALGVFGSMVPIAIRRLDVVP